MRHGGWLIDRAMAVPTIARGVGYVRSRPWLFGAVASGLAGLALLAMRPAPSQETGLVAGDRMAGVEQVEALERVPPRWDDWSAASEPFFDPQVELSAVGSAVELIPPPPRPSVDVGAWPRAAREIRPAAYTSANFGAPRGAWLTGGIETLD